MGGFKPTEKVWPLARTPCENVCRCKIFHLPHRRSRGGGPYEQSVDEAMAVLTQRSDLSWKAAGGLLTRPAGELAEFGVIPSKKAPSFRGGGGAP